MDNTEPFIITLKCGFPGCTVQTGTITFPAGSNPSVNPADHGIEDSRCDEHPPGP